MIGVDFGGTSIKAAYIQDGRVERRTSRNTQAGSSPETIADDIAAAVRDLDPKPTAVGLAFPGEIDEQGCVWRLPNVPGFEGYPLAKKLADRLGCVVAIENDATAAAIGELYHGAGRDVRDFLVVTLGTGIGGGLVLDGRVHRGRHGFGGEIGHAPIRFPGEGATCGCGKPGCIESYAGTRGLLKKYQELGGKATSILPIAEAARAGEEAALGVFHHLGKSLGMLFAVCQDFLDLDAYILTGGVALSFDLFEQPLRASLRRNVMIERPLGDVRITVSELGPQAGVFGAAQLVGLPEIPRAKPSQAVG